MAPTNNKKAKGKAGAGKPKAKKGPPSAKKPAVKKKESSAPSASSRSSKPKELKSRKTHLSWRRKVLADEKSPKQIATVPYTLEGEEDKKWPSALFLDAKYPRDTGILVVEDDDDNYFEESDGYTNREKSAVGPRSLPCLTKTEAMLWCHKHAAHTAVARRFPVEAARLLGTITLEIQEIHNKKKKAAPPPHSHKPLDIAPHSASEKFLERVKHITKKQASGEATTEALQERNKQPIRHSHVQARATEIQQQWSAIQNSLPHRQTWHPERGALPVGDNDEHHVHLHDLKSWLEKGLKAGSLKDLQEDATREFYNGLTRISINATDILSALVDLSEPLPCGYGVPLLVAYPRMIRSKDKKKNVWNIQIGVYMHRLLPEVLTIQTLHTIISALDEGSYTVSQPVSLPPMGPEVFASAPYPKVDTSLMEYEDGIDASEENDVIDVDLETGGDRDELLLSPFSTKGLLKLLENKGCDVSNWPQLERQLRGKFKLDLLLHQQHAICWMVQMENLKGAYGINSLLWEQRSFPDGGHYYYSPALGQVRLGAPPPLMKGGLLCDEQGLGKTVEVLGLIMATLPEMKQHAKAQSETKKKKPTYNYDGDNYYDVDSSEDEDEYIAHTTLIIVPPALVVQWLHEIEKAVGKNTLTVSLLLSSTGDLQTCLPPPQSSADLEREEDTDETLWEKIQASDIILTTYDSLDNKRACSKTLQNVQWGRVVLDEMQEIRSSTTQIAKNCEKLQCNKRWMLSGTPLFQGVEDLRGELNFLRLEPFGAAWEDGFFDFAVQKPWDQKDPHAIATLQILGLVALRRSKDMTIAETGGSLLDLKPMVVEYVPVSQSHSERALYCWMEYIVACEIQGRINVTKPENAAAERADAKSRVLCLRLLRELAISPMLLNGGLGCPSQLDAINQLMIRHNRREQLAQAAKTEDDEDGEAGAARKRQEGVRVMSCDQALRFLTQHQQSARTDKDFVTDVAFGGGRGVTNREHANESAEKRYEKARKEVADAEKVLSEGTKKRAAAHWHVALEMITTGRYTDGRSHKFSALWKWRRIVCDAIERQEQRKTTRRNSKGKHPPALLTRGWRPSPSFSQDLFESHPEFSWAHPHALFAQSIPKEVTQKELAIAMRDAAKLAPSAKKEHEKYTARLSKLLETQKEEGNKKKHAKKIQEIEEKLEGIENNMEDWKQHDAKLKLPSVIRVRERKHVKGFWKAIVQFESNRVIKLVMSAASRASGASLNCRQSVPHINAMIKAAKENLAQAESERQVHPSEANKKLLAQAKKELADIIDGLKMIPNGAISAASLPTTAAALLREESITLPHVLLSKASGPHRSAAPRWMTHFVDSAKISVEEASEKILRQQQAIARNNRVIEQLEKVVTGEVSEEVNQLSAFGILEALAHGELEKTSCPICLGHLGCDADDDDTPAGAARLSAKKKAAQKKKKVAITMVNCGHFFCSPCLNEYVHGRISSYQQVNCPNCRQVFNLSQDTIQVDHTLTDEQEQREKERQAAKETVRKAGKMLEESKGQLTADMWRLLYLAFDVPGDVPNRGHWYLTAIPRDVLTHLRAATGMEVHKKRNERPALGSPKGAGRCSKIEALLRDLPTGERAVIFSSNKDCLMHIRTVLQEEAIGCQSIYTGQSTDELKHAVSNWETPGESPADPPPFPCLLVQAGAAAAGLTLTAASKMFIMEPFLRQEEEHQAYARCHRYSQKHKVSVKIYYTPVSVESRLLEWRKGAKKSAVGEFSSEGEFESNFEKDTRVIYHDIDEESEDGKDDNSSSSSYKEEEEEDGDDSDNDDDVAQANYLLGLLDKKHA